MDQNLKQRLVGAVVLISLAVLFLPLVFDGQQERIDIDDYAIPEKPVITIESPDLQPIEHQAKEVIEAIAEVEAAKAEQDQLGNTMAVVESVELPEPTAQAKEVVVPPSAHDQVSAFVQKEQATDKQVKEQGPDANLALGEAWIIQVGAFSSQANANGLRDRLNQSGYNAYTKASSNLFKVYVGPEIRKYRLEQQKAKLENEFSVKTMILKYIP